MNKKDEIYAGYGTSTTFDGEHFHFYRFEDGHWNLVNSMHVSVFHNKWRQDLLVNGELGNYLDDENKEGVR